MDMTGEAERGPMQHDPSEQTTSLSTAEDGFFTQLDYGLPWDEFLVSNQFLFPFSPPHSINPGGPDNNCSGLQPEDVHRNHDSDMSGSVHDRHTEDYHESDGSLTPEEEDILVAEYIPHVPPLGAEMRAHILEKLKNELQPVQIESLGRKFPTSRHLDTYVQLYFEHFHPHLPILHVPTFRTSPKAWVLVLAMVCLGCDYSKAGLKSEHRPLLQSLAQQFLKSDVSRHRDEDILTRAQALLLFQHVCLSIGRPDALVDVQLYRNVLVTLCRQFISQDGNSLHNHLVSDTTNHTWLQWVRSESRRRLVYFMWLNECYQSVLFMLPPLLAIHELQIALPGAESRWCSNYEQWRYRSPPSSTTSICSTIARISAGTTIQEDFEQPARMMTLFTAFAQHVASQNLMRAMMPFSEDASSAGASVIIPTDKLWHKALDVLLKAGCSQPLRNSESGARPNDFAVGARLLTILDFTPSRLLFPFSKWQTSARGYEKARIELLGILSNDAPRARYSLYLAAQLFRHFRSTQASTYFDTLALLMTVLYFVSYIELIELQRLDIASREDAKSVAEVVRLDQAISENELDDWLHLRRHLRPHVTGLGPLDTDRSVARVFKEASRISANNSVTSTLAGAFSAVFNTSAEGKPPDFPNSQSEPENSLDDHS